MANPNPQNQFKPGQSGNPKGAPKREWRWSDLYVEAVEESDETGVPIKKIIAKNLARLAARGDVPAIRELTNRTDGMPRENLDLTGGQKIDVNIRDYTTQHNPATEAENSPKEE